MVRRILALLLLVILFGLALWAGSLGKDRLLSVQSLEVPQPLIWLAGAVAAMVVRLAGVAESD